ncbi:DUF4112 domain-containing protein [Sulfitobacter sp. D35]|uniref:DUF4112 domain-containing protein n=1 Tax=Sulfitobacter sp. D35 TaxID=3083252 RepID=UPI00296E3DDB|nr:DUF4112 domain-containing protein [Sulfitobacter sp. D35]MDW4499716.1 DUF4112 domain-containing protein [Sulfitobacter sp. D35]
MPTDATYTPIPDRDADLRRAERIARLLDTRWRIPGTPLRFGFDSIVGLVPGVGDTVMLLPSLWMIYTAYRHGARGAVLAKMAGNAGVDFFVGSVPVLGDVFDLFFKSHRRNAALLRDTLAARA